jgi:hypothetical protein
VHHYYFPKHPVFPYSPLAIHHSPKNIPQALPAGYFF